MIWKPDRAMHFDSLKSERVSYFGESTIFQLGVHKPFRFVEYVRITKKFFLETWDFHFVKYSTHVLPF